MSTEAQTNMQAAASEVTSSTSPSHSVAPPADKKAYMFTDLQLTTTINNGEIIEESDYTPEQYKKLTRKIDRYLLPLLFFCYGIQQTDKTSISTQALFGMRKDLGFHGQQYQWLTTIFYLTYLIGEFPSVWIMQRWHLGYTLSIFMTGWGICLMCIAAAQNWSQVMALRALQGLFECAITPGFLFVTASWYKANEHADRSLFWQSSEGFFSIVCNLMLYGIARHVEAHGGLAAWRCISLFLGGLTLVGAVVCFFVLGSPHEVRWLSKEEKRMATARTINNNQGQDTTGKHWDWDQVVEAFKDPQLYFGFANTFLSNIPNGAITTFSSLMYETFGFDEWQSMLYGCPRNAVYVGVFLLVALYTRKVPNQRLWVMIVSTIIPFAGILAMSLLPNTPEHKWTKYAMFILTVVFSLSIFLGWSLIPSNVAGRTKRTVVSSLTLISYCAGNMAGAQVFQTKDAPRYVPGTIACSVCFGVQVVVILFWRFWYMYENRRRDRVVAESGVSKEEQQRLARELGENDVTDMKNPYFRYAM